MQQKIKNMDAFTKVLFLFIAIGGICGFIYAIKQIFDAEADKNDIIQSQKSNISTLKTNLDIANAEIKSKSDSIEKLAKQTLTFSKKIDLNTETISGLTDEISKVTSKTKDIANEISIISSKTNELANEIKNEQKQRGVVKLKRPNSNVFSIVFGSNTVSVTSDMFEEGVPIGRLYSNVGFDIHVKFHEDQVLVSTILNDEMGNVVVELNDSEWVLNKTNFLSINYDDSALEIINNQGLIIFQMEFKNKTLTMSGIYYTEENAIVYSNQGQFVIPISTENFKGQLKKSASNIIRIFQHTGEDYLGKRTIESIKQNKEEYIEQISIEKELEDFYVEIDNALLTKKTNSVISELDRLIIMGNENMNELIEKRNINEMQNINLKIINNYKRSIRKEAIKIKNTLLARISYNDRDNWYNDLFYATPKNYFPDLKIIKEDLYFAFH